MRTLGICVLVGILIGAALVTLLVGWKLALAVAVIDIVAVLAGLAARAWDRGTAMHAQLVREEVDQHREAELDDPDPFATRRRVEYRDDTDPTYDLTVTNPRDPSEPARTHHGLTIGQLADHLAAHDARTYLAEADAATITAPDGTQLTWQPSTTDTGETR